MKGSVPFPVVEVSHAMGRERALDRPLAIEMPVAFEVNGIAYAVMMATPTDLEDYATGFALAEGMIGQPSDILDLSFHETGEACLVRLTLDQERAGPLLERVRMRLTEGSCGLCGLDSIEEVLRPLPTVETDLAVEHSAVRRAVSDLTTFQLEGRRTGAMHAAAFCRADGSIVLAREDVGRHNALDKLVGALARAGTDPASGFVLVSARCSYELVEKTARAGCPMLVAISAPTTLAVDRARGAGMTLIALARDDSMLVVCDGAARLRPSLADHAA